MKYILVIDQTHISCDCHSSVCLTNNSQLLIKIVYLLSVSPILCSSCLRQFILLSVPLLLKSLYSRQRSIPFPVTPQVVYQAATIAWSKTWDITSPTLADKKIFLASLDSQWKILNLMIYVVSLGFNMKLNILYKLTYLWYIL